MAENPKPGVMEVRIEDDGTFTIVTGPFSEERHEEADEALKILEELCGEKRITQQLPIRHTHVQTGRHVEQRRHIGR